MRAMGFSVALLQQRHSQIAVVTIQYWKDSL